MGRYARGDGDPSWCGSDVFRASRRDLFGARMRTRNMSDGRSGLVNGLRDSGHAVVYELGISTCRCGDLLERATGFVEAALMVADRASPGRAYIRLSCSHGLLLVEITHLRPGTFAALTVDDAATIALDGLRAWSDEFGGALTIERGPRDQFRVTLVIGPGAEDFSAVAAESKVTVYGA